MEKYQALVDVIKKHKLYQSLPDSFVEKEVKYYFRKYPAKEKALLKQQSKQYKALVRGVRGQLHEVYGRFQVVKKNREQYLTQLPSLAAHEALLGTHKSTKERVGQYALLYEALFGVAGKPKSILDLGCGMNPVSFPWMGLKKAKYFAYDIDASVVSFLAAYFKQMQISGAVESLDISNLDKVSELPEADVAFLFNVVDTLERGKGHKFGEALLGVIPAKWIVLSFSTKTVSGRGMRHPYRGWLERMLERLHLTFTRIMEEDEVFYVVKK